MLSQHDNIVKRKVLVMSKTIGLVLALKDECSPKLKEVADKIGVTEKELKRANQAIAKFQKEIGTGIKNACKVAMVGLGALAGATVMTINQTREYADRVDDMSKQIGLSKKGFQEWDYIIKRFGGNIEGLKMGMKTLVTQTINANSGNKAAIANFQKLGISIKNNNGQLKNQEQLFEEVVAKLQKYPDGVAKAKLANDLFGRSGADLMPMFKENATAISELKTEMEKLDIVMSDEQIEAANTCSDNLETIQRGFGVITMSLGNELIPTVNELAKTLISNMPQIKATVVPVFKSIAEIVQFVIKHIKAITIATTLCVASFATFKTLSFVGGVLTSISETIEITKGGIGLLKVANYALGQSADFANAKITLMFGWQKLKGVLEAVTTAQWSLNTAVTAFSRISIILILAEIIIHFKDICKWTKNATDAVRKFLGEDNKQLNAKVAQARPQIKYVVDSRGKAWDKNQYQIKNGQAVKINGSHANGLANVPFNGYVAELHKGERVLTASENKNYNTTTNNTERTININFYGDIIGDESFLQKLENRFTTRLRAELGAL